MPSGLFYSYSLDRYIVNTRGVKLVFVIPCFIRIPAFKANKVDPDQTPRSVASDLGLQCLPISHFQKRITVQWHNRKCHDSVNPNITSEIRDRSSEILIGKKATEHPIIMRFSISEAEMNCL